MTLQLTSVTDHRFTERHFQTLDGDPQTEVVTRHHRGGWQLSLTICLPRVFLRANVTRARTDCVTRKMAEVTDYLLANGDIPDSISRERNDLTDSSY